MGKLRDQLASGKVARDNFESRQTERLHKEARADRDQSLTALLSGLTFFYLVIRFGATQRLDALGTYASYLFELSLVALTLLLLRPKLSLRALTKPVALAISFLALVSGFGLRKLAAVAGLSVPMDSHSTETVVFLLAVAPILEELVFRFMIFRSIERVFQSRSAWFVSSLLFSYSHLHAIWFVPADYHRFLIYQTIYTFPLALACGWMVRRQSSLLAAILVHATFNLGFFLAF